MADRTQGADASGADAAVLPAGELSQVLRWSLVATAALAALAQAGPSPAVRGLGVLLGLVVLVGAGVVAAPRIPAARRGPWWWVLAGGVLALAPVGIGLRVVHDPAPLVWLLPIGALVVTGAMLPRWVSSSSSVYRDLLVGGTVFAGLTLANVELVVRAARRDDGTAMVAALLVGTVALSAVAVRVSEPVETVADRFAALAVVLAVGAVLATLASTGPVASLAVASAGAAAAAVVWATQEPSPRVRTSTMRSWLVLCLAGLILPISSALLAHASSDWRTAVVAIGEFVLIGLLIAVIWKLISDALAHADEIEAMVGTDAMTGLSNRTGFERDVDRALAEDPGRSVTVAMIALDGYTELRERLGQATAEQLQVAAAQRLVEALPDVAGLAHLQADVFAALTLTADDRTGQRAQRLVDAIREPLDLPQVSLSVNALVGLASSPVGGTCAADLIAAAELALDSARGPGSAVVRYSGELQRRDALAAQLVGELNEAIARGEVIVYFQPQLDLRTGEVSGAEALVRWMHPALGLLGPAAFVPAAETTGSIRVITLHVLDQALYWCARWARSGRALNVSVNLSAGDLLHARLVDDVRSALARYGLPASRLELEITETMAMADVELSQRVLTDLARLGVTISIDDYGTGYGSLAYLQKLPVRRLKIDRSFVSRILDDEASTAIVRSTIELAAELGLGTVAEGVEDDATIERLRQFGCDLVQGFGLAAPISAEGFERVIWRLEHRSRFALGRATPGVPTPASDPTTPRAAFPSVAAARQQIVDRTWASGVSDQDGASAEPSAVGVHAAAGPAQQAPTAGAAGTAGAVISRRSLRAVQAPTQAAGSVAGLRAAAAADRGSAEP